MAIQIPNAGTGNGATGDNEFVLWTKVINNFSDQTNAASRLVGTGAEQIPLSKNIPSLLGTAATKDDSRYVKADATGGIVPSITVKDRSLISTAMLSNRSMAIANFIDDGAIWYSAGLVLRTMGDSAIVLSHNTARNLVYTRVTNLKESGYNTIAAGEVLVAGMNAKADSNGFYKTSSPTIDVYADKIVANDEANEQNPTFKRNGVGDYAITTQTGLSTDGWYIELPKDLNGNPKVAVTLEETDGVISLKSYKRIFSMETFTFEPDLDNPLDIPDGRWIDLRLNEIPADIPDDIQTEV